MTVNYHRRRDAAFAAECAEALDTGYAGLEAMLIERAARGAAYTPGKNAEDAPGPDTLDTPLAVHLLELRAREIGRRTGKAGQPLRRVSEKELNEAILAKLELLDRRLAKAGKKAAQ